MTRALHIDCFSGISGDMMLGALVDLGVPEAILQEALSSLNLPGKLVVEPVRKSGFAATKIRVDTPHEHAHRHLSHILKIIESGLLTDGARSIAERMFRRLGEAEAASHGIAIEKVHFHEVGAVDSIFDFVGIAVALDWLAVQQMSSTPVPTGQGFVQCDHGKLPVPAPAVARLLEGIPLAECAIDAELTTPTGAAVIATMVHTFCRQPRMTIEKIGIGAGTKDFEEQPNILRLFLGTASEDAVATGERDVIWKLETNIDDVPAEVLGYTVECLIEHGALDAYTTPILMKKNRPAVQLTVLCEDLKRAALEKMIFAETGTLGIRRQSVERAKLERQLVQISTPWGPIQGKVAWNDSTKVFTPEFDDCARVARRENVPLRVVYDKVRQAFEMPGDLE